MFASLLRTFLAYKIYMFRDRSWLMTKLGEAFNESVHVIYWFYLFIHLRNGLRHRDLWNLGEYNLSSIHVLTWKLSTNCFTARPRSPETIAPATYHKTWVNACKKCTIVWKHIFLIKRVVGGGQHDLLFERPGFNFQMLKNRGWARACTCWWDACSYLLVIQRVSQLNLVILYPQDFMYHGLDWAKQRHIHRTFKEHVENKTDLICPLRKKWSDGIFHSVKHN